MVKNPGFVLRPIAPYVIASLGVAYWDTLPLEEEKGSEWCSFLGKMTLSTTLTSTTLTRELATYCGLLLQRRNKRPLIGEKVFLDILHQDANPNTNNRQLQTFEHNLATTNQANEHIKQAIKRCPPLRCEPEVGLRHEGAPRPHRTLPPPPVLPASSYTMYIYIYIYIYIHTYIS